MNVPGRALLACAFASAALTLSGPAQAREAADFTEAAFAQAQAQGRTVLIDAYAPWCAACKVQEPLLAKVTDREPYVDIVLLRIGMLTPETVWRRLGINAYGTLKLFRHGKGIAQGTPQDEAQLIRLLDKGR